MKILITGATGFVGSRILELLYEQGYDDIRVLTRNKERLLKNTPLPIEVFQWKPNESFIEKDALLGVDIIIHLAGESVAGGRWSEQRKRDILESRKLGTQLLINSIKDLERAPIKFISSSAVGIYGSRGSEEINETASLGKGFLADTCKIWEDIILSANIEGMKVATLRTGIVLGQNGGALEKMLPPFRAGIGGTLGSGKQYMSWIHRDDLVAQYIFLIKNIDLEGPFNGVSPFPLTNKDFTKVLGRVLGRPTVFPVPGFILKAIFGEMSEILLEGQRVIPKKLEDKGFAFKYENLEKALTHLLSNFNSFKKYQWVNKKSNEVFNFFSKEENLEKITPPNMKFSVAQISTPSIQDGTIIDYDLKVHSIPMKWKSEISNFTKGKKFTDTQLKGPYKSWVHTHEFIDVKGGTLIKDDIKYQIPMGFIGNLFGGIIIRRDINAIFNYRVKTLNSIFN